MTREEIIKRLSISGENTKKEIADWLKSPDEIGLIELINSLKELLRTMRV